MLRLFLLVLAIVLVFGLVGCGPSASKVAENWAQAVLVDKDFNKARQWEIDGSHADLVNTIKGFTEDDKTKKMLDGVKIVSVAALPTKIPRGVNDASITVNFTLDGKLTEDACINVCLDVFCADIVENHRELLPKTIYYEMTGMNLSDEEAATVAKDIIPVEMLAMRGQLLAGLNKAVPDRRLTSDDQAEIIMVKVKRKWKVAGIETSTQALDAKLGGVALTDPKLAEALYKAWRPLLLASFPMLAKRIGASGQPGDTGGGQPVSEAPEVHEDESRVGESVLPAPVDDSLPARMVFATGLSGNEPVGAATSFSHVTDVYCLAYMDIPAGSVCQIKGTHLPTKTVVKGPLRTLEKFSIAYWLPFHTPSGIPDGTWDVEFLLDGEVKGRGQFTVVN